MYFSGLIHKGIMYKTFIMENCYLLYLIRNLLKQNHSSAYGIMFLGFSRLKNNCHLLLYFFTYSNKLQAYLLICSTNESGDLKNHFHGFQGALDGPLSEVWLGLSCLHLGKHLDVRQFLHSQTGDDSAYLARSWPNLHVGTGAASHECPSISASCRDSFLCCLFLWMTPWSSCREPDRGMRAGKGN